MSQSAIQDGGVSRLSIAALAGVSLPMAMLSLPLTVAVPEYFGNALGLDLALVGVIFMAIRILDIVIDPFLGLLMDGTTTRWGRFRPWLLAGMPLVVCATAALFMPPADAGPLWLTGGLIIAYVGWSIVSLAQLSLAAGLASGYGARARVYAWLQACFFLGVCLVMLLPLLLGNAGNDAATSLQSMGWLIIATVVVVAAIFWTLVPEVAVHRERTALGLRAYLRLVGRPAVLRLLLADIVLGLGYGIASAMLLFYFIAVKELDRNVFGILLIAQMGTAMISMPFTAHLAARIGKHVMLAITSVAMVVIAPSMMLVPKGEVPGAALVMAVWGICYGAATFLPRSMMADASDEARLETGVDRTGVLYALLISSWKLGGALSVGIGYLALDLIGYQAQRGTQNSAEALAAVERLFVGAPALLALIGSLFVWRYPITPARSAAIRQALGRNDAAAALAPAPIISASALPVSAS